MRAPGSADLVVVPQTGVVDEWPAGSSRGDVHAAFERYFIALCNRVGSKDRLTFAGESFVCARCASSPAHRVARRRCWRTSRLPARRTHARRVLLKDRRPELIEWICRKVETDLSRSLNNSRRTFVPCILIAYMKYEALKIG
jgi:hypothetical protein